MPTLIVVDASGASAAIESIIGEPVMHTLRQHSRVAAICGGLCACGTCHVFLDPVWTSKVAPRQPDETALLATLRHFDQARSRLSCQIQNTPALDGLTLTVAPEE